jgi:hypothetical protein
MHPTSGDASPPRPATIADPTGIVSAASTAEPAAPAEPVEAAAATFETRNFAVLVLYQIVMRTGWIFKTESIIMPAVMDMIGGPAWLRACLPMLNRLGQSVPALFFAQRLQEMPRKKWGLAAGTSGMALSLFALASLWLLPSTGGTLWIPLVFLGLYALFFASNGISQLSWGTLQGKLIRATRRGRLLTLSDTIGAGLAILCAWTLLSMWLRPNEGDFQYIFGFAGGCSAMAAAATLLLAEPTDSRASSARLTAARQVHAAWQVLRRDAGFRRLAVVAALFGTSMMLFPHYQAIGRERLGLTMENLMGWVIVQNAGTALFSVAAGPLADRFGNRLVLRLNMLAIASLPLGALALAHAGGTGKSLFFLLFAVLGITPITFKTLNNYTLETCPPADHPRYLSTLGLCLAAPIVFSPLVGWIIDVANFETAFLIIAALLATGWLLTFGLSEPRHGPLRPPPPMG